MKKSLIVFLLNIFYLTASSQNLTQSVKGNIIDLDTQTPLPGATIIIENSNPIIGTSTDLNGDFHLLSVPVGRYNFIISYMGYEDVILNEILVSTGREVVLNISMKESLKNIEEVVVIANKDKRKSINSMTTVSSRQITIEETSRIAAGINDPGRTVQSYAGVAAFDDENNEIVVRGNSPRGVLWRMEGVEIPNPNHFSNGDAGSGGGVSALSTEVLASSDFMTGAFPAEYGNALSGVFDLKLRKGNSDKREYSFQLGVLGIQAAAEGPIANTKQASYLINYRYSTLTLLNKIGIDIGDSDIYPEYQDVSFNINLTTKKLGRFSLFGLGGLSEAGDLPVGDSTDWVYRSDTYGETEDHKVALMGLTHNYILKNNKTYIKTIVLYSYNNNSLIEDSLGTNYISSVTEYEDISYSTLTLSSYVNNKFNAKHILRTGIVYHNKSFHIHVKDFNFDENQLITEIDHSGSTDVYESYLQWKFRINSKFDLNSGVRYIYHNLNNEQVIEPRIGASWRLNNKHTINIGAGLHSRSEPISFYLAEKQSTNGDIETPNKNVGITKAAHIVLGYNWNFKNDFRLKTEVYYQYLYDVPVMKGDTTGIASALNFSSEFTSEIYENKGTGKNYGIELTFEKFFSRNYYFMLTSSLFESKYKIPEFEERNTLFNGKYILSFAGGKEFLVGKTRKNVLGINLRTILRGGYRTIPIDLEQSRLRNNEYLINDQAYETKAPDYFRIDLGVSYRKNKPKYSWVLSLDVQNLTNRENIWDQYYDEEKGTLEDITMVGLIPILNYRIEF